MDGEEEEPRPTDYCNKGMYTISDDDLFLSFSFQYTGNYKKHTDLYPQVNYHGNSIKTMRISVEARYMHFSLLQDHLTDECSEVLLSLGRAISTYYMFTGGIGPHRSRKS